MRQVMCITKRGGHSNPHERIQGIGGVVNGVRWWRAEDDAIRDVQVDGTSYYTRVQGRIAWVVIATHNGRKYLKTEDDGYSPDNLLSLPECPSR